MIFIFSLFAAVSVFLSYKSWRGGIDYLNYFRRELARPPSNFTQFATIFAPCRGIDDGFRENLTALFHQNYPAYEIVFVVDDAADECVKIIEKLIGENAARASAQIFVAGKARNESQKVHNLRRAVSEAADSKIFVFVDSDARPAPNWLQNLIAPLEDENIGATTGYRWFIAKKPSLSTEFRAVWNASIASALGANTKNNFCWGGSTAVRRETFENLEITEKWRGTLSDDFVVTRAMKKAELPIYFVPQALTATVENCGWRELFEFTTRQMKITRVYAPRLYAASFVGSFLFNLVFVSGVLLLVSKSAFGIPLVSLVLISAFSAGKAHLRLRAVKLALNDYEPELKKQFWTQHTLWIFSPALFLCNNIAAAFSRKIVWREIEYQLISPEQTSIITRK